MAKTVQEMMCGLAGIHAKIAKDAGLEHAKVRCKICGKKLIVDGGNCLAHGWPKCCGYTMTLITKKQRKLQ
jgi:hypothetical protein